MPALFLRTMLCLDRNLRTTCKETTRFDAIAHHPYPVGAPAKAARNPDDVSVPDLHKLTRPVAVAVRLGRALPRTPKALWVTEIAYDSAPPDPDGVPSRRHARFVAQTLAFLNRQGASVVTWFLIRDQEPEPSFAASRQSGMYLRDGRSKTSQRAMAFPVVATSSTRTRARLWLRAPATGTITLERRIRGVWRFAGRVRARRHEVIQRSIELRGATAFRARQGGRTSLSWEQGTPRRRAPVRFG